MVAAGLVRAPRQRLGVLLYLFMHIVETSTVLFGPEVYNAAVGIFKNLPARIGEVVLMAALVYHALNGIRVIAMDFLARPHDLLPSADLRRDRPTVVAMIPLGLLMIRPFIPWGEAEPMTTVTRRPRVIYANPSRPPAPRPRHPAASASGGTSCAVTAWRW